MKPLTPNTHPPQGQPGNQSVCLEAALGYCARGWSVIPLEGKRPHVLEWKPFQNFRPREDIIRWWYQRSWPNAGVGIVCGRVSGGLAVVDVDDQDLAERLIQSGMGTVTRLVKTPRGHIHLYLRETHRNSRSGPLVVRGRHIGELRAEGNYVAAPPSPGYTLLSDRPPLEVPDAKAWAVSLLAQHGAIVDASRSQAPTYKTLHERPLAIGERDATLASLAGLLRHKNFPVHVIEAALTGINTQLCQPPLSAAQIQKIATSIGSYPGGNGFDSSAYTPIVATESKWRTAKEFLQQVQWVEIPWVWDGYLARGLTTLLSARAKIGKTTLLFHLLQALLRGQPAFLDRRLQFKGKVLLLSEEPKEVLTKRLERFGLVGEELLIIRQFDVRGWPETLGQVRLAIEREGVSLVVLDVIDKFWGLKDENEAQEVVQTLKPLQAVIQEHQVALLIHHHLRKQPGEEGTAHRGSGALVGAVDIALELYGHQNRTCRRTLKAMSRLEETPVELVLELTPQGYTSLGGAAVVEREERKRAIVAVLPEMEDQAATYDELYQRLDKRIGETLLKELANELYQPDGRIRRRGGGARGDPYRFWKASAETGQTSAESTR